MPGTVSHDAPSGRAWTVVLGRLAPRIGRCLRWLIVARLDRKTSLAQTLLAAAAVTAVGLTLGSDRLRLPRDIAAYDAHAFWSIALAVDWVHCGKYSVHSTTYDLTHYLVAHNVELEHLPVPAILDRIAGSKDKYCAAVTQPVLNNENSLFYLDSALLSIRPNITLAQLGASLTWIRVAGLVFFVCALLSVGASPLLALITMLLGVEIGSLSAPLHLYSTYPFLLPMLASYGSLLALPLEFDWHRKRARLAAASFAIGLFGGFFYNLRTSYLPIVVGSFLLFAAMVVVEGRRARVSPPSDPWKRAGIALASFLAGTALFSLVFTYPLTRIGASGNYTYHAVLHPVVLSLALPPSALSQREGIRWSDPVGLEIARRVDPQANYLGPTYERALATYYASLWRGHPREMLSIYLEKWRMAMTGTAAFVRTDMSPLARHLFAPTERLTSGFGFTVLFVVVLIAAFWLGLRFSPSGGVLVATLAAAGLWVAIESVIIMPFFFLQYHNAQLFVLFVINLVLFQAVVNGAWWLVTGDAHVRPRTSVS